MLVGMRLHQWGGIGIVGTSIGEEMEGPDVFQVTSACDVFQGQAVLCAQITSSFLAVCAVNIDMASDYLNEELHIGESADVLTVCTVLASL